MISDRTYNNIDIDVYSKPWSKCARRIWAHILILQPNLYGIFDSPLGAILDFWEDMYERRKVMEAIEELKTIGCLKTYRNGDLWWVVKKFKREMRFHRSRQHLSGVNKHLDKFPEVRVDFHKVYQGYYEGFQSPSDGDNKPMARASKGYGKGMTRASQPPANSDTDSDTEDKEKEPKPLTEHQLKVKPMAEKAIAIINQHTGQKNKNKNLDECIKTIDQLIRLDKVPGNDVIQVLQWALTDDFWGNKLLSIKQWRNNKTGNAKFYNAWDSWKKQDQGYSNHNPLAGAPYVPPSKRPKPEPTELEKKQAAKRAEFDARPLDEVIAEQKAMPKPWKDRKNKLEAGKVAMKEKNGELQTDEEAKA